MLTQHRSKAKASSARYHKSRDKRVYEMGSEPILTKIGGTKKISHRIKGGSIKTKALRTDVANIYDKKTKKYSQTKIKTVSENPANRHFIRRNILTKGTIIETDAGKAIITNRPGQEGTINAVLI